MSSSAATGSIGYSICDYYARLFKNKTKNKCREAVRFILDRNIIWGDALTLKTVGEKPGHIVFSEWSPVNGSMLKRRDFTFHGLLEHAAHEGTAALLRSWRGRVHPHAGKGISR